MQHIEFAHKAHSQPTHVPEPKTNPKRFPQPTKKTEGSRKPSPLELAAKLSKKKKTDPSPEGALAEIEVTQTLSSEVMAAEATPCDSIEGLSAQMEALCDKMLTGLEVMQEKGITKTRLILSPPNPLSIFNGSEVELTQYDSSPLHLNIEFFGTEQASLVLASSVATLERMLKENAKETKIGRIDISLRSKPTHHKKVTESDEL